jgi:hypothetical protein
MASTLASHKLDAAIAASAPPTEVRLQEIRVDIGPGRVVMLAVPPDLQLSELVGLVGYLTAGGLATTMAAARGPVLEVPGGIHVVPRGG